MSARKPKARFGWTEEAHKKANPHARVLEWLLAEDEIKPERPEDIREGMGEGANPEYLNGYSESNSNQHMLTVAGEAWKDHKPLQSDWTRRAAAMLVETGARCAVPEGASHLHTPHLVKDDPRRAIRVA